MKSKWILDAHGLMQLSYADCFAAALAKKYEGKVITGDKGFGQVEEDIEIFWL